VAALADRVYPLQGRQKEPTEALILLRQHLDQRLGGLLVDRFSFWAHWREIAEYLIPRRYKWLIVPNQAARGSPINQRIIDNTATRALRILAAGMMAGITSPGRPWFRLTLEDKDLAEFASVKQWLDEVVSRMHTVYAESNFYTSLATLYEDLGAFGTGALIIYEDFEDVIRCYNSCAGEYFLANSDRLAVDTLYRQFVQTTKQVGTKFGLEASSATVRAAWETKGAHLSREVIVAHAIEPNDATVPGAQGLRGMTYREVYWEWGSASHLILSQRGFHECPFVAPRWSIVGNDAYGRSPGMDSLGDIKQLQIEQKRKAQAIDKLVNPPMVADVQLKNEPATLLPGGVTYVSGVANGVGFKPVYEVKPDLEAMIMDLNDVRGRINGAFMTDLFMMISQLDTVRTATEVDARREEKLIQLGPVLERFMNEALDPAIDRTFNIMFRAGLLPPPPRELRGQHIKTEYISMLAQAQRAAMTAGIERLSAFVGNLVAANPEAIDNLDTDEMIDEYADLLGVPAKVVRPMAQVVKMRAQRAQQAQQQQALQQTMAGVQGAKVLSDVNVGGGRNAIQAMLGT
jgi:Bacteriophage head to tail connecting protein